MLVFLLLPVCCFSQLTVGVKGGLNFANIADASDINNSSKTCYMLGGYIGPKKEMDSVFALKSFFPTRAIITKQTPTQAM